MVTPIKEYGTYGAMKDRGPYAIADNRDDALRRLIESAYDGGVLIIRLKKRGKRKRVYAPDDPNEVTYDSALEALQNKRRVNIQWAPYPS